MSLGYTSVYKLTAVMGLSLKYRPVIKAKTNNC